MKIISFFEFAHRWQCCDYTGRVSHLKFDYEGKLVLISLITKYWYNRGPPEEMTRAGPIILFLYKKKIDSVPRGLKVSTDNARRIIDPLGSNISHPAPRYYYGYCITIFNISIFQELLSSDILGGKSKTKLLLLMLDSASGSDISYLGAPSL